MLLRFQALHCCLPFYPVSSGSVLCTASCTLIFFLKSTFIIYNNLTISVLNLHSRIARSTAFRVWSRSAKHHVRQVFDSGDRHSRSSNARHLREQGTLSFKNALLAYIYCTYRRIDYTLRYVYNQYFNRVLVTFIFPYVSSTKVQLSHRIRVDLRYTFSLVFYI